MVTEKSFALFHTAFWHRATPLLTDAVRQLNGACQRFCAPMVTASHADRGLVNESAFRLFVAASALGVSPTAVVGPALEACCEDAYNFISRFREHSRASIKPLTSSDLQEVRELATRTAWLFDWLVAEGYAPAGSVGTTQPHFRGCGWVDACDGDVLYSGILCEIKAGQRRFIGRDLRQLLIYVALHDLAPDGLLHSVCLCNPRLGSAAVVDVEALCQRVAGVSRGELVDEIVAYMSEGLWRPEPLG